MPHGCERVGGCCASRVGWWARGRGGRGRGVGRCARGVCVAVRCRKRLAALARLRHTGRLPRRASSGGLLQPRVPRPSNRSVASVRHAPTSSSPPSPLLLAVGCIFAELLGRKPLFPGQLLGCGAGPGRASPARFLQTATRIGRPHGSSARHGAQPPGALADAPECASPCQSPPRPARLSLPKRPALPAFGQPAPACKPVHGHQIPTTWKP